MESLIKVFHRYAKDSRLSRRELRELMENELSNFLKVQNQHPSPAHFSLSEV